MYATASKSLIAAGFAGREPFTMARRLITPSCRAAVVLRETVRPKRYDITLFKRTFGRVTLVELRCVADCNNRHRTTQRQAPK